MKLFQQMLVAGVTLSLITPIGAQASGVNIEEIDTYIRKQSSSKKQNQLTSKSFSNEIATRKQKEGSSKSEVNFSQFEAGGFSDTTTMNGKAIFTLGAVDYDDNSASEAVGGFYSYTLNLNSSFTGDDNLYVRLKTGNHDDAFSESKTYGTYLSSAKGSGDALNVDKIWYQFPVGENNTIWIGPKIENYYMHGTTPSIYKPVTKQFALGGNGNAYGASTDTGFGWAYQGDSGFAISSNIGTKSRTTTDGVNTGLLSAESKTSWATQIGYTKPSYSVSAIMNVKSNGWSDSYYKAGDINGDAADTDSFTAIGLRGWWRPENTGSAVPSISLGYDTTDYDVTNGQSKADAWFIGMNWQDIFNVDDKIGFAYGQPTANGSTSETPSAYELYYSFKPNDSITMTPAIFGGADRNGVSGGSIFGAVFETTFKF